MGTYIPTLSTLGWVNTIEEKGDFALSYFITSEYSQSVFYYGKISSLQWLVHMYGNDSDMLQTMVRENLENMMRGYFGEDVTVNVMVSENDAELNPGKLTIRFSCQVRQDGREYSLGRSVEFINAKLTNIMKINNG